MSTDCQHQTLDTLREELREMSWLERKHHRSLLLNKNRAVLGESKENENFTEEFVRSKAMRLKSKSLTIEEYGQLQNAFIQCEENINAFLNVDNAIHSLICELSGNNPDLQVAAANCCCNIAIGNNRACTTLAKAAVPYLIAILDGVNYNLMDICIWTIGNLAAGSEKAFKILHAQGTLHLLSSLLNDCQPTLLPSVMYAALHYVYAGYNFIEHSELIDMAQAALQHEIQQNDHNMMWLLAMLSSRTACVEYFSNHLPQLIHALYDAAKSNFPDIVQVTAIVRILGNTISEPSGQIANLLLRHTKHVESDVQFLLDKLLSQPHIHLRKETLWLIGNLCNHPLPDVTQQTEHLVSGLKWLQLSVTSVTSPI